MLRWRGSTSRGWTTIIPSSRLAMSIFGPTPGSRRVGLYALLVLTGATVAVEVGRVSGVRKQALEGDLELARAQVELDQDELDDAGQDLIRAGGDPQAQIRRLVQEHEAATHGESGHPASSGPATVGTAMP